jgi:hypothetical protein
MNDLTLSGALATNPSSAFAELRERPRFWFPLLLIVLSTAILAFWYYTIVDIDWLKDAMFSNNADIQKMPEAERAQAMAMVSRGTMRWGSVIGVCFALPIFFVLHAVYLLIAAKVTKMPFGFKHWFSLTCWTAMPLLISNVVAAILLLIAENPQIGPGAMQPLSLNELLLHRPFGSPGQAFFESLTIPGVLGWILLIIGVRTWSQRSWLFSSIVALIPVVLLYGIWSAFAFR